jgi:hypothetical protein
MAQNCRNQERKATHPRTTEFRHLLSYTVNLRCLAAGPLIQLSCVECGSAKFDKGPIDYCMHRDEQHRAFNAAYVGCQFCGRIYRTPHEFHNHQCMRDWEATETLINFTQALKLRRELANDNSSFEVYELSSTEKNPLLTCLGCGKPFHYISGLTSHFNESTRCAEFYAAPGESTNSDSMAMASNSLAARDGIHQYFYNFSIFFLSFF